MLVKKITLLLLSVFLLYGTSQAQQTTIYTEANQFFKEGLDFYNRGLLGKAKRSFEEVQELLRPLNDPEAELLHSKAGLFIAKSAVRLEQPDGELATLNYIRRQKPDPSYDEALIDLANFYFNKREYNKALQYYADVPTRGMTRKDRAEVRFRMGYAHFIKKDFNKAKTLFKEVSRDRTSPYYAETNYYLGLCYFFEGDYLSAVNTFQIVEDNPSYRRQIPYYIAQIYFAQREFNQLIDYVQPKINDTRLSNRKELNQLLGQAYFELGKYQQALPYLEYYGANSSKMSEEELYQLGYAQYQSREYRKAIQSFKPLVTVDSRTGQFASFYLADCYLQLGDKRNALTGLASAKRMRYDQEIREEALFNHAKLAYELGRPEQAINDLQSIAPTSRYFPEAQQLMGDIFLSYRNYAQALQVLDEVRRQSNNPQLLEAFQKVAVNRGIQLLREEQLNEAQRHFELSLETPVDVKTKALAHYWLGEIAHRRDQYDTSIEELDRFLTLTRSVDNLPESSSVFTANYLQGYNFLKQDNYQKARGYFQQTVEGIQRNRRFLDNKEVSNNVLGDATMRLGDSYFKYNEYDAALQYYNEAINRRYAGYDYAIFQKALIQGLKGRKTEEIVALQRLIREFKNSEFADDALLRLGTSYQEVGRLSEAERPLKDLIKDYPNSTLINQALLKLGLISYNQGNLQQAIDYYKRVFSNNAEPEEAQIAKAALEEIYVRDLGRPGDYFAFLETIPGYKADNFSRDSITYKSALTQFENANYERAIDAFTNYLRQFPKGLNVIPARYNRGESYSVQRQYSRALQDYEYVVDQGPSKYYLKALEKAAIIAYNHELDFQKAYELYSKLEEAATSEDQLFEAQLGALRAAYRADNTTAVYSLAQKVANNRRATESQQATANFYLGKLAFDNGNYDQALPALQETVALSDNEQPAEARYLIAYIYYKKRELDKAKELCLEANQESSAYPFWVAKSVLLLSDILAEQGDLYNARAALEALIENFDQDPELVRQAQDRLQQINRQIEQSSKLRSGNQRGGNLETQEGGN